VIEPVDRLDQAKACNLKQVLERFLGAPITRRQLASEAKMAAHQLLSRYSVAVRPPPREQVVIAQTINRRHVGRTSSHCQRAVRRRRSQIDASSPWLLFNLGRSDRDGRRHSDRDSGRHIVARARQDRRDPRLTPPKNRLGSVAGRRRRQPNARALQALPGRLHEDPAAGQCSRWDRDTASVTPIRDYPRSALNNHRRLDQVHPRDPLSIDPEAAVGDSPVSAGERSSEPPAREPGRSTPDAPSHVTRSAEAAGRCFATT
jgi:hypothetical protein